ncbi:MAG TPA: hypothetical protein VFE53_10150 [Mucilaginibacter sp.]|jgi:hypothetical protein|nr:hypothetical protein [Mucilaginibacter sp.]
MDLYLQAYKPAQNFTLAERAERMVRQQRLISEELNNWIWYLHDKSSIDLRDDACHELIYKQAKRGMNTKMAKITRYQPNDIPDMQSRCLFLKSTDFRSNPFSVSHHLGYFGEYSKVEYIHIDRLENEQDLNGEANVKGLVRKIIRGYDPAVLYLTSSKYICDISKAPDDIPRTGWMTYLKNNIRLPDSMPDFCQVEQLMSGTLFCTIDGMFDEDDPQHVAAAVRLSKWFEKNKVKG